MRAMPDVDLRGIAGKFLAERERRRILGMGAADLDDAMRTALVLASSAPCRCVSAGRSRCAISCAAAICMAVGKAVVRRLAHIDVIVGMDRRLGAELAAELFVGAVGDHLVDVHVGLGAGAGLPDHQREMHRRACRRRSPAPPATIALARRRVERAELEIGLGRGALDDGERARSAGAACAPRRCGNFCASARSARPNSGRPALRWGRTSRFRCGFIGLSDDGRRTSRCIVRGVRRPSSAPHFFRNRSRRTTSPPLPASAVASARSARRRRAGNASALFGSGRRVRARPGDCLRRFSRQSSACARRLGLDRLELQAELHRRIEERRHRLERHHQPLRHAAERQADFETVVADDQIPELVLQDDRHRLRILRAHALRQPHARRRGGERDLEMVLAGQAVLGRVREHGAHHAAQGSWARMS